MKKSELGLGYAGRASLAVNFTLQESNQPPGSKVNYIHKTAWSLRQGASSIPAKRLRLVQYRH